MTQGRVVQVNVSAGGVPKLPVAVARVTRGGVEGDRQRDVTVHGGPHRAVSILGIEAIERVRAEGHPIAAGTTGENLTTAGFDVSTLPVGTRLEVGDDLVLELSGVANPCRTIRHSFRELRFGRLGVATHPADSRMYARVVAEGTVRPGDPIRVVAPIDDAAARFTIAERLEAAERASALSLWRAAADAGFEVHLLDDGELAAAAAPTLPGPVFNSALGFTNLPHLVDVAVRFFASHGTTGWVWADEPPWPGATADANAVYAAGAPDAVGADEGSDGVVVRELAPSEVGPWSSVLAAAADLSPEVADAFVRLEPGLARAAHHHRFVAELDGRPVAAGSLHTHRGVGWLRAGAVLPEARGRGVHQALIAARAAHAGRVGCELIGASANQGGASARNLDRLRFGTVAIRRRYRADDEAVANA
jgi:MOSC domain-containing protein YiiM/GNAT superfamily N-acetyltransferase